MKSFLKMLLASILGGGILLFLIFIIFASLISMSAPEMEVAENTILRIDMNTTIVERAQKNPFAAFDPLSGEPEAALGLNKVLAALNAAQNDDKIIGVYLSGGIPMGDAASMTELRNAVLDFRESGKFVYGYSEILTQKGYYLASAADSFFVNPEGFMEWMGLSASVAYYKEALAKIGVKPVVLRATGNKFKSAVEPFLTQKMTEENRFQLSELLGSVWDTYLNDISASTGLERGFLNQLADTMTVTSPKAAAENGLIGGTLYQDQIDSLLASKAGKTNIKNVAFLSPQEYAKGYDISGQQDYTEKKVAVIIAQGSIQGGEGSEYSIGSDRIASAIRKARKDQSVKAIVLRVNSPGGSALASEIIWREVALARQEKPVIASMGGLAASGGYYISCYADTIVAQPNTITGSIGAFGLFFTAEELLNDKLGVNIETVTTNEYADLGTIDRDLTPAERKILIKQVDDIYNTFTQRVATGRNLEQAYVDSIGQGRVYSGLDAQKLGLVDVIGGLEKAISIATEKANIADDYRVVEYPEPKDPLKALIEDLSKNYQAKIIHNELGEYAQYLQILKKADQMQGYQTRMEYDLVID